MDPSANAVAQSIDGATGDWTMSGDAMRWSPDLAEGKPAGGELHGIELASGVGTGLGFDVTGLRQLVSGALTSLGTVAGQAVGDLVGELRERSRGGSDEECD